jgi:riboflavin kinase/FMN adenylyltransferase
MTPRGLDDLPPIGPAVVTLGVFDGVHRGHRRVAAATSEAARSRSSSCVALVFSPHPDEVIRPGTRVPRILPPAVTIERLRAAGVDHAIEIRFDAGVRNLEPEAFLDALAPALEIRAITMAPDSAFGRGRAGTLERVRAIGRQTGFDAIAVEPEATGAVPISSSRIRELIAEGQIEAASELLDGRPVLRGTVVAGDRRGRELGFPTANLDFAYHPQLPRLGIYLGAVSVPSRGVGPGHPALVSVGVRPTFHDDGRVLVEVYLLDWDGDLYGAELSVELIARLRDERRFESVDALVQQMREDEAEARRRWSADGG